MCHNITAHLMSQVQLYGGLDEAVVCRKLVAVAADGASVMQGCISGVLMQLLLGHAPLVLPYHCAAHRWDLCAAAAGKHKMLAGVKQLLHVSYNYFSKSPQRLHQLTKVCAVEANTPGWYVC